MGKQTSLGTRAIIIDLHKKGKSLRQIGAIINRHHCTIKKILDKFVQHDTICLNQDDQNV